MTEDGHSEAALEPDRGAADPNAHTPWPGIRRSEHTSTLTDLLKSPQSSPAALAHLQRLSQLGLIASGLAHDLNNILTVITGYCELHKQSGSSLPEIEDATKKGTELVSRFTRLSKTGQQPTYQNINHVIENYHTLLTSLVGHDIRLHTRLEEDLGWVCGSNIDLILLNLVTNAKDAMPQGGTLTITTATREPGPSSKVPPGRYATLAVEDTGRGIPPDELACLFEPFYTTRKDGIGLGLSTVQHAVEQNKGHIAVLSTVGKGTSFTIYFPEVERATPPTGAHRI